MTGEVGGGDWGRVTGEVGGGDWGRVTGEVGGGDWGRVIGEVGGGDWGRVIGEGGRTGSPAVGSFAGAGVRAMTGAKTASTMVRCQRNCSCRLM